MSRCLAAHSCCQYSLGGFGFSGGGRSKCGSVMRAVASVGVGLAAAGVIEEIPKGLSARGAAGDFPKKVSRLTLGVFGCAGSSCSSGTVSELVDAAVDLA